MRGILGWNHPLILTFDPNFQQDILADRIIIRDPELMEQRFEWKAAQIWSPAVLKPPKVERMEPENVSDNRRFEGCFFLLQVDKYSPENWKMMVSNKEYLLQAAPCSKWGTMVANYLRPSGDDLY